jgi:hypothetical protein
MTRTENNQAPRKRGEWARARGSRPFDRAIHARRRLSTPQTNRSRTKADRHGANPDRPGPNPMAKVCASETETGPTITAVLQRGPLAGRRIEADVVEGRPPKTIDVRTDDGSTCRYCLADWAQTGPTAIYTSLYLV